ncbi:ECF transporter S component [Mycoplasmopsis bovirhinis]|uniref:ECF transporter S component n=1 Tax=Mycoplasmopsis bovirhinis TaxID=29553 RepID=UPI001F20C0DC|nr:ECF transporter S component [Mycoplasmopsis bovirhinis]
MNKTYIPFNIHLSTNQLNQNIIFWGLLIPLYLAVLASRIYYFKIEWQMWQHIKDKIKYEGNGVFNFTFLKLSLFIPLSDIYRYFFLFALFKEGDYYICNWKEGSKRNNLKFSVYDIALGAILMSLFFIITALKNFTPLRIISLSTEYIFYIIFTIFFGKYKGAFFSFLADFFSLLLSGQIALYHEAYAIVPIAVSFLIGFILDIFKKNKKQVFIFMEIFMLLSFGLLIYTFLVNVNDPKGLRISSTFGISRLSVGVFGTLLALTLGMFALFNLLVYWYFTEKNPGKKQSYLYLSLTIFLVIFTIVLARWIWGPIAFIQYANRYLGRSYNLQNRYVIVMTPIVLRSVIALPIYILVLNIIIPVLFKLKKTIVRSDYKITY